MLRVSLDEGKQKLEGGEDLVPFTALVVKDNLFLETHPGENAEECFEAAEANVRGARGAGGYAFCYDGYIETDDGVKDAIIADLERQLNDKRADDNAIAQALIIAGLPLEDTAEYTRLVCELMV